MANKTSKTTKTKRLSKGQRTHIRRLKQVARKEASTNSPKSRPAAASASTQRSRNNLNEVN